MITQVINTALDLSWFEHLLRQINRLEQFSNLDIRYDALGVSLCTRGSPYKSHRTLSFFPVKCDAPTNFIVFSSPDHDVSVGISTWTPESEGDSTFEGTNRIEEYKMRSLFEYEVSADTDHEVGVFTIPATHVRDLVWLAAKFLPNTKFYAEAIQNQAVVTVAITRRAAVAFARDEDWQGHPVFRYGEWYEAPKKRDYADDPRYSHTAEQFEYHYFETAQQAVAWFECPSIKMNRFHETDHDRALQAITAAGGEFLARSHTTQDQFLYYYRINEPPEPEPEPEPEPNPAKGQE